MRLSAESLFHFTSQQEFLTGILEKGFMPRYCLEDFSHMIPQLRGSGQPIENAYPMVCFCDIRLSQTKDHALLYGKFIIGMKKEWGIKNGVSPIYYMHPNSPAVALGIISEDMMTLMMRATGKRNYAEIGKKLADAGLAIKPVVFKEVNMNKPLQVAEALLTLSGILTQVGMWFKPVYGRMYKGDGFINRYFYDEREWRFVMNYDRDGVDGMKPWKDCLPILHTQQFLDKGVRAREQARLDRYFGNQGLRFNEDDVTCILVPTTAEIEPFKEMLRRTLTRLDADKLCDKVSSYEKVEDKIEKFEEIEDDF